ncbi:MAG: hypothetical protein GC149_02005 [Gammaproteobacteria bacterium]|nr:hypothetical protein [Gammaproteobacteria bacterium]
MLEFIFFHETPHRLFVDWLKEKGLAPESSIEDETFQVALPEDLDDALYDEIEEKYETFMEMNEEILREENADEAGYHMAGIAVHLKDGNVSYADIDPKLLGRVMGAITAEEFAIIVDAIVTAVENPQDRTFCQRQRDKDTE